MDKLHASGDMVLGEDVTCSKTKPCDVAFSLQPHITISHLPLLISIGYINHSICILQPQLALKSITTYLTNNKFEHFDPSSAFKKRQCLGSLARKMAILMPRIIQGKQILRRSLSNGSSNKYMAIPKGYFTIYVGEQEKKRFVVPISLLDQPAFQELLCQAR